MSDSQSLADYVYDAILKEVLENRLRPGQMLTRREVAKRFDISIAPVSEAMLKLEHDGFLESFSRKGTRIRPIMDEDLFGALMLREALEIQAAVLYHGEPVTTVRDELVELAREVDACVPGSIEKDERDIALHTRLVELSDCRRLIDEYLKVGRVIIFHTLNTRSTPEEITAQSDHVRLIGCLESHDRAQVIADLRSHLRNNKSEFLEKWTASRGSPSHAVATDTEDEMGEADTQTG